MVCEENTPSRPAPEDVLMETESKSDERTRVCLGARVPTWFPGSAASSRGFFLHRPPAGCLAALPLWAELARRAASRRESEETRGRHQSRRRGESSRESSGRTTHWRADETVMKTSCGHTSHAAEMHRADSDVQCLHHPPSCSLSPSLSPFFFNFAITGRRIEQRFLCRALGGEVQGGQV